jgi:hypothetical protein
MNRIKRFAGILWMALGPVAMYFLIKTALEEIERNPLLDTKIQWGVFVVVFFPIAIGMVTFGYYALCGEYDHLPQDAEV